MKKLAILFFAISLSFIAKANDDTTAVKSIQGITDKMLELISVEIGEDVDWDAYRNLFLPTAQKISINKKAPPNRQVRAFNLEEFIRNVGPLYGRDGFLEYSTGLTVNEFNGIATAFQSYYCKNLKGTYEAKGINCYQLVFADNRWWIANTVFTSEDDLNKIPKEYLFSEQEQKK